MHTRRYQGKITKGAKIYLLPKSYSVNFHQAFEMSEITLNVLYFIQLLGADIFLLCSIFARILPFELQELVGEEPTDFMKGDCKMSCQSRSPPSAQ